MSLAVYVWLLLAENWSHCVTAALEDFKNRKKMLQDWNLLIISIKNLERDSNVTVAA